jgi:hypothetical protein
MGNEKALRAPFGYKSPLPFGNGLPFEPESGDLAVLDRFAVLALNGFHLVLEAQL